MPDQAPPFSCLKKISAIFLLISFTLSESFSYALPVARQPQSLVPAKWGTIEKQISGHSGKRIYLIEDIHDSLEAQKNIANLVSRLVDKAGVQTVFEEGYAGPVPTEKYFGWIKDEKAKKRAADHFLDQLLIGGAEYAHIVQKNRVQGPGSRVQRKKQASTQNSVPGTLHPRYGFQLIGIEDRAAYFENLKSAKEAGKNREEVLNDLSALEAGVDKLIRLGFPREMLEWMKLRDIAQKTPEAFSVYLQRSLAMIQSKPETEPGSAAAMIQRLIKNPKKFHQGFQGEQLHQLIRDFEKEVAQNLLPKNEDRELWETREALHGFIQLAKLRVSEADYQELRESLETLNSKSLARVLAKRSKRSWIFSRRWERGIQNAIRFYEAALKRDQAVTRNLELQIAQGHSQNMALVFGGFHRDALVEKIREWGHACIVIQPSIKSENPKYEARYQKLLDTLPETASDLKNQLGLRPLFNVRGGEQLVREWVGDVASMDPELRSEMRTDSAANFDEGLYATMLEEITHLDPVQDRARLRTMHRRFYDYFIHDIDTGAAAEILKADKQNFRDGVRWPLTKVARSLMLYDLHQEHRQNGIPEAQLFDAAKTYYKKLENFWDPSNEAHQGVRELSKRQGLLTREAEAAEKERIKTEQAKLEMEHGVWLFVEDSHDVLCILRGLEAETDPQLGVPVRSFQGARGITSWRDYLEKLLKLQPFADYSRVRDNKRVTPYTMFLKLDYPGSPSAAWTNLFAGIRPALRVDADLAPHLIYVREIRLAPPLATVVDGEVAPGLPAPPHLILVLDPQRLLVDPAVALQPKNLRTPQILKEIPIIFLRGPLGEQLNPASIPDLEMSPDELAKFVIKTTDPDEKKWDVLSRLTRKALRREVLPVTRMRFFSDEDRARYLDTVYRTEAQRQAYWERMKFQAQMDAAAGIPAQVNPSLSESERDRIIKVIDSKKSQSGALQEKLRTAGLDPGNQSRYKLAVRYADLLRGKLWPLVQILGARRGNDRLFQDANLTKKSASLYRFADQIENRASESAAFENHEVFSNPWLLAIFCALVIREWGVADPRVNKQADETARQVVQILSEGHAFNENRIRQLEALVKTTAPTPVSDAEVKEKDAALWKLVLEPSYEEKMAEITAGDSGRAEALLRWERKAKHNFTLPKLDWSSSEKATASLEAVQYLEMELEQREITISDQAKRWRARWEELKAWRAWLEDAEAHHWLDLGNVPDLRSLSADEREKLNEQARSRSIAVHGTWALVMERYLEKLKQVLEKKKAVALSAKPSVSAETSVAADARSELRGDLGRKSPAAVPSRPARGELHPNLVDLGTASGGTLRSRSELRSKPSRRDFLFYASRIMVLAGAAGTAFLVSEKEEPKKSSQTVGAELEQHQIFLGYLEDLAKTARRMNEFQTKDYEEAVYPTQQDWTAQLNRLADGFPVWIGKTQTDALIRGKAGTRILFYFPQSGGRRAAAAGSSEEIRQRIRDLSQQIASGAILPESAEGRNAIGSALDTLCRALRSEMRVSRLVERLEKLNGRTIKDKKGSLYKLRTSRYQDPENNGTYLFIIADTTGPAPLLIDGTRWNLSSKNKGIYGELFDQGSAVSYVLFDISKTNLSIQLEAIETLPDYQNRGIAKAMARKWSRLMDAGSTLKIENIIEKETVDRIVGEIGPAKQKKAFEKSHFGKLFLKKRAGFEITAIKTSGGTISASLRKAARRSEMREEGPVIVWKDSSGSDKQLTHREAYFRIREYLQKHENLVGPMEFTEGYSFTFIGPKAWSRLMEWKPENQTLSFQWQYPRDWQARDQKLKYRYIQVDVLQGSIKISVTTQATGLEGRVVIKRSEKEISGLIGLGVEEGRLVLILSKEIADIWNRFLSGESPAEAKSSNPGKLRTWIAKPARETEGAVYPKIIFSPEEAEERRQSGQLQILSWDDMIQSSESAPSVAPDSSPESSGKVISATAGETAGTPLPDAAPQGETPAAPESAIAVSAAAAEKIKFVLKKAAHRKTIEVLSMEPEEAESVLNFLKQSDKNPRRLKDWRAAILAALQAPENASVETMIPRRGFGFRWAKLKFEALQNEWLAYRKFAKSLFHSSSPLGLFECSVNIVRAAFAADPEGARSVMAQWGVPGDEQEKILKTVAERQKKINPEFGQPSSLRSELRHQTESELPNWVPILHGLSEAERDRRVQEAIRYRKEKAGLSDEAIAHARWLLDTFGAHPFKSPKEKKFRTLEEINRLLSNVLRRKVKVLFWDLTDGSTGSFKDYAPILPYDRVWNALMNGGVMPEEVDVVSTGNHAIAGTESVNLAKKGYVLRAQTPLDLTARAYMGRDAAPHKIREVRQRGGEVIQRGPDGKVLKGYADAEKLVEARVDGERIIQIRHADPSVVSGYSVPPLEMHEELSEYESEYGIPQDGSGAALGVPVGSAGLVAGQKQLQSYRPRLKVYGASASPADLFFSSLWARQSNPDAELVKANIPGFMWNDGIAATPEEYAMRLTGDSADGFFLVPDPATIPVLGLLQKGGIITEPTTALFLAAILLYPEKFDGIHTFIAPVTSRHQSKKLIHEIKTHWAPAPDLFSRTQQYYDKIRSELRHEHHPDSYQRFLQVTAKPGFVESVSGIRTQVGEDAVSPELLSAFSLYAYLQFTEARIRYAKRNQPVKIVLARDSRPSSAQIAEAVKKGWLAAAREILIDCDVEYLGVASTPMAEFAVRHLRADRGAIVTGSHLGLTHNGIKLMGWAGALWQDDRMRHLISKFQSQRKEPLVLRGSIAKIHQSEPSLEWFHPDSNLTRNVREEYTHWIKDVLFAGMDWSVFSGHEFLAHTNGGALAAVLEGETLSHYLTIMKSLGLKARDLHSGGLGRPSQGMDPAAAENFRAIAALAAPDAFVAAFDYDADRVNFGIDPQQLTSLNVAAALTMEVLRRKRQPSNQEMVVVATDGTSLAIEAIAKRFRNQGYPVRVRRVETGEANVIQVMDEERHAGREAVIGVEGPNGGTILGESTSRDGIVSQILFHFFLKSPQIQAKWLEISGRQAGPALPLLSFTQLIQSLPARQIRLEKKVIPPQQAVSRSKQLYRTVQDRMGKLRRNPYMDAYRKFKAERYHGVKRTERQRGLSEGGYRILFENRSGGLESLWFRASGTETGTVRYQLDAADEAGVKWLRGILDYLTDGELVFPETSPASASPRSELRGDLARKPPAAVPSHQERGELRNTDIPVQFFKIFKKAASLQEHEINGLVNQASRLYLATGTDMTPQRRIAHFLLLKWIAPESQEFTKSVIAQIQKDLKSRDASGISSVKNEKEESDSETFFLRLIIEAALDHLFTRKSAAGQTLRSEWTADAKRKIIKFLFYYLDDPLFAENFIKRTIGSLGWKGRDDIEEQVLGLLNQVFVFDDKLAIPAGKYLVKSLANPDSEVRARAARILNRLMDAVYGAYKEDVITGGNIAAQEEIKPGQSYTAVAVAWNDLLRSREAEANSPNPVRSELRGGLQRKPPAAVPIHQERGELRQKKSQKNPQARAGKPQKKQARGDDHSQNLAVLRGLLQDFLKAKDFERGEAALTQWGQRAEELRMLSQAASLALEVVHRHGNIQSNQVIQIFNELAARDGDENRIGEHTAGYKVAAKRLAYWLDQEEIASSQEPAQTAWHIRELLIKEPGWADLDNKLILYLVSILSNLDRGSHESQSRESALWQIVRSAPDGKAILARWVAYVLDPHNQEKMLTLAGRAIQQEHMDQAVFMDALNEKIGELLQEEKIPLLAGQLIHWKETFQLPEADRSVAHSGESRSELRQELSTEMAEALRLFGTLFQGSGDYQNKDHFFFKEIFQEANRRGIVLDFTAEEGVLNDEHPLREHVLRKCGKLQITEELLNVIRAGMILRGLVGVDEEMSPQNPLASLRGMIEPRTMVAAYVAMKDMGFTDAQIFSALKGDTGLPGLPAKRIKIVNKATARTAVEELLSVYEDYVRRAAAISRSELRIVPNYRDIEQNAEVKHSLNRFLQYGRAQDLREFLDAVQKYRRLDQGATYILKSFGQFTSPQSRARREQAVAAYRKLEDADNALIHRLADWLAEWSGSTLNPERQNYHQRAWAMRGLWKSQGWAEIDGLLAGHLVKSILIKYEKLRRSPDKIDWPNAYANKQIEYLKKLFAENPTLIFPAFRENLQAHAEDLGRLLKNLALNSEAVDRLDEAMKQEAAASQEKWQAVTQAAARSEVRSKLDDVEAKAKNLALAQLLTQYLEHGGDGLERVMTAVQDWNLIPQMATILMRNFPDSEGPSKDLRLERWKSAALRLIAETSGAEALSGRMAEWIGESPESTKSVWERDHQDIAVKAVNQLKDSWKNLDDLLIRHLVKQILSKRQKVRDAVRGGKPMDDRISSKLTRLAREQAQHLKAQVSHGGESFEKALRESLEQPDPELIGALIKEVSPKEQLEGLDLRMRSKLAAEKNELWSQIMSAARSEVRQMKLEDRGTQKKEVRVDFREFAADPKAGGFSEAQREEVLALAASRKDVRLLFVNVDPSHPRYRDILGLTQMQPLKGKVEMSFGNQPMTRRDEPGAVRMDLFKNEQFRPSLSKAVVFQYRDEQGVTDSAGTFAVALAASSALQGAQALDRNLPEGIRWDKNYYATQAKAAELDRWTQTQAAAVVFSWSA